MSKTNKPKRTKSGRFRKGQSGNPKGRPKKVISRELSSSTYDVVVDRTLTVTKDGVARDVTFEEALQHKTYQYALEGDRVAQKEVLRMILKRELALAKQAPKKVRNVEICSGCNPTNANEAAMLLGIGRRYDLEPGDTQDRWKLEPWAVQAALRRRRGGARLTSKEVAEIKRSTWNPEAIDWPRGTPE